MEEHVSVSDTFCVCVCVCVLFPFDNTNFLLVSRWAFWGLPTQKCALRGKEKKNLMWNTKYMKLGKKMLIYIRTSRKKDTKPSSSNHYF